MKQVWYSVGLKDRLKTFAPFLPVRKVLPPCRFAGRLLAALTKNASTVIMTSYEA
jgi:hypothetical protein